MNDERADSASAQRRQLRRDAPSANDPLDGGPASESGESKPGEKTRPADAPHAAVRSVADAPEPVPGADASTRPAPAHPGSTLPPGSAARSGSAAAPDSDVRPGAAPQPDRGTRLVAEGAIPIARADAPRHPSPAALSGDAVPPGAAVPPRPVPPSSTPPSATPPSAPPPSATPPIPAVLVDPLSPDGALPASRARIPGSLHEYTRLPTGPLDMPVTTAGPDADSIGPAVPTDALWHPAPTPMSVRRGHLGEWSLMAAIVSLVASFFVGWVLPIALIAVVLAAVAIRRPTESRGVSGWALALGLVATVYSVGWLVYATTQLW